MSKAPLVFDASKSTISEKQMQVWLSSEITENVTQVPGIGPAAVDKLAAADVVTTHQLLGKYLSLRGKRFSQQQHNDYFMEWLKSVGINSHREGITYAIAEKLSVLLPTAYEGE
jgi:hypothetical protein